MFAIWTSYLIKVTYFVCIFFKCLDLSRKSETEPLSVTAVALSARVQKLLRTWTDAHIQTARFSGSGNPRRPRGSWLGRDNVNTA